jgi:hypothetical protein
VLPIILPTSAARLPRAPRAARRRRRRRRRRRPRRQEFRMSPSKNTVVQVYYSGRLMASLARQTLAKNTRATVFIAAPRAGAQGRISANQHGHCAAARVTGFSITYTARALGRMLQGIAGNRKGEFWVEAQFLSKLHTNMAIFCLNNIQGHKKRGSCS